MPEIKVTNDSTVIIPERSGLFGVERKDWNRIKKLINDLSSKPSFLENAAWFSSAGTLSFLISFFSVDSGNVYKATFLIAAIFTAIITAILFYVNHLFSKNTKKDKQRILDEMEKMEIAIPNIGSSSFEILEAWYGKDENIVDVKNNLASKIINNTLSIVASNEIVGDPCPGVRKTLRVKFKVGETESIKEVDEGETINLP